MKIYTWGYFHNKQAKILCPKNALNENLINQYNANDGYEGITCCTKMKKADNLCLIKRSNLRF